MSVPADRLDELQPEVLGDVARAAQEHDVEGDLGHVAAVVAGDHQRRSTALARSPDELPGPDRPAYPLPGGMPVWETAPVPLDTAPTAAPFHFVRAGAERACV